MNDQLRSVVGRTGLRDRSYRSLLTCADDRRVDYLLPDATDLERQRTCDRFACLQTVDEILHGILIGWIQRIDWNRVCIRALASLYGDRILVVVTADSTIGTNQFETAFGLCLSDPWIREGAPSCLNLGQASFVTSNGNAMFVDFDSRSFVHNRSDFDRNFSVVIPSS